MTKLISWIKSFITPSQKSTSVDNAKNTIENYIGMMSFKLTEESDVDVMCVLPNIKDANTDQIATLAEKYADFLLAINEGFLKDDIVNILQKNVNKNNDPKDTLFLENILFYWALAHVETQKKKKNEEKKDQPVIRPLSVFSPP